MVYHFFSKWKGIESEVFSIKKELVEAEKVYRLKIRLFKKIWDMFGEKKIDFKNSRKLLKIYTHPAYSKLYQSIADKIRTVTAIGLMPSGEIDQFYELMFGINEKTKEQNSLAVSVLEELISNKFPDKPKFYRIMDMLSVESQFIKIENERFNKIENAFLIKSEPGAESGGYVHILKAITRGLVKFHHNLLWIGTSPVQGLKVRHNKIIIKGDHYAPLQNAKWIQGDMYVRPSQRDPYSYFVERGKLGGWKRQQIQKALGISSAEAVVSLEIDIYPEQLYIKIQQGVPLKFAVAQLAPEQVRKVIREAKLVAA